LKVQRVKEAMTQIYQKLQVNICQRIWHLPPLPCLDIQNPHTCHLKWVYTQITIEVLLYVLLWNMQLIKESAQPDVRHEISRLVKPMTQVCKHSSHCLVLLPKIIMPLFESQSHIQGACFHELFSHRDWMPPSTTIWNSRRSRPRPGTGTTGFDCFDQHIARRAVSEYTRAAVEFLRRLRFWSFPPSY
jgi:hypothetical protein